MRHDSVRSSSDSRATSWNAWRLAQMVYTPMSATITSSTATSTTISRTTRS